MMSLLLPLLSQVLLDTPGMVPHRYGHRLGLSKAFLSDPSRALLETDMSEWVAIVFLSQADTSAVWWVVGAHVH